MSVSFQTSLTAFCDSGLSKSCRRSFTTAQYDDRAAAKAVAIRAGWSIGVSKARCPSCIAAERA